MKQYLIDLMKKVNEKVYLQGSLNSGEKYDESFKIYDQRRDRRSAETPEDQFYDNNSNQAVWGFWVYIYAEYPWDVEFMENSLIDIFKKDNKTILSGKGQDVASDVKTHYGRMLTVYLIENYGEV